MEEFIILIREDMSGQENMPEVDFEAEIQAYVEWVEEMSKTGNYISGDPLKPAGRYIHKDNFASDGPFIESKEAISGYVLIKAKDLDEATALAKKCPIFESGGAIELRPIMKT